MRERVIKIDDVEVIDAPDRRGPAISQPVAEGGTPAWHFAHLVKLTLRVLVALLSVIIVVALAVGGVLGMALRRAQGLLSDRAR